MSKRALAVLKITLDGVEPKVVRRIVMQSDIRLDRLHLAIQAAMGWTNTHLYEFRIGGAGWGESDPDGIYHGPMDASKGRLSAVLVDAGCKTFTYLYDYGDGWSHTVTLEKIVPMTEDEPPLLLLDASGRCPPEDCGGPSGYERLLEILADPAHAEHDETLDRCGGPFDPDRADFPTLEAAVDLLARRWTPRRRASTKPRA